MINSYHLPPGLLGIFSSLILILLPKKLIKTSSVVISCLILVASFNLNQIPNFEYKIAGLELTLFTSQNPYSYIFTLAFSLAL
ncbi:MAG: hypothetical protein ACK4OM_07420, partial [Alphaproteobacteria bacterium]